MNRWCRRLPTSEVVQMLKEADRSEPFEDARWRGVVWCLQQDPRQHVRQWARTVQVSVENALANQSALYRYEQRLWSLGYVVAGIDEVGRGSLAGPVIASAVIFPRFSPLWQVADSKVLTTIQREALYPTIYERALAVSIGSAEAEEVDRVNVHQASKQAMIRAVTGLTVQPDHLLIDAMELSELPMSAWSVVRGDALSGSIAAASIVAKVTRDRMMLQLHQVFPQYGFDRHKGYATRDHLEALAHFGPCAAHRVSYEPIRRLVNIG